jgi:restriction system protein
MLDVAADADRRQMPERTHCPYCRCTLERFVSEQRGDPDKRPPNIEVGVPFNLAGSVDVCATCGWWKRSGFVVYEDIVCDFGILRALDFADVEVPLTEIRAHLLVQYERRLEIHPRRMEQVVASVMADSVFIADVTAYSADGGIDVVLRGPGDTLVGVQVKRYRHSIKVEQVRALMGALILGGMTKGMFVTTSSFHPGAVQAAKRSGELGMPIELIDAERFFDALRLTTRPQYHTFEEWMEAVGDFQEVLLDFRIT